MVKSLSLSLHEKGKTTLWTLEMILAEFNNWLYWLIVSLLHYASDVFTDEDLAGLELKDARKIKLQARKQLLTFEVAHRIFMNAAERVQQGQKLSKSRNEEEDGTTVQIKGKVGKNGFNCLSN